MELGTTTKKRPLYFPAFWQDSTTTIPPFGTGIPTITKGGNSIVGGQTTVSTSTIWPYLVKAKRLYKGTGLTFRNVDAGGNFYTSIAYCDPPTGVYLFRRHNAFTTSTFEGDVYTYSYNTPSSFKALPYLTVSETQTLLAYGTTAIARCIPTNPVSGLANFLGELRRDGLPSVPGSQMMSNVDRLRSTGSEYLNVEFALKPTLNDLKSFATAVKTHDKVLKQYIKDSGKSIKRRYSFPTEVTVIRNEEVVSTSWRPSGIASKYSPSGGTLKRTTVQTVDRWFTGEFCYYLSLDDDRLSKMRLFVDKADLLFGIKPDPELIWNLAPWSWAADWVANYGDVFHNVSAFLTDGLVMKRAYVMEKTTIVDVYESSAIPGYPGGTDIPPLKQTFTQTRKVRIKASPFGFGKLITDLSPRQLAIIAALGISRRPDLGK